METQLTLRESHGQNRCVVHVQHGNGVHYLCGGEPLGDCYFYCPTSCGQGRKLHVDNGDFFFRECNSGDAHEHARRLSAQLIEQESASEPEG